MEYNKICIICDKEFTAQKSNAKCCSQKCNTKNCYQRYRIDYKKTCSYCNVQFTSVRSNATFCSKECRARHTYKNNKESILKRCRQWQQNNLKQYKEQNKKWRQANRERLNEKNKIHNKRATKRGITAWNSVLSRCNNPNSSSFKSYGKKGIKCSLSRDEFLEIYFKTDICEECGIKLNDDNRWAFNGRNIDRIDPNGHYEKKNVRIICKSCNSKLSHK